MGDGTGCVAQLGMTARSSRRCQDGRGVGPHCERNRNHPLSSLVAAEREETGGSLTCLLHNKFHKAVHYRMLQNLRYK
jgi:hypothetical protein